MERQHRQQLLPSAHDSGPGRQPPDKFTQNADLWPKSYATEFTNTSTPAARTNTGTYLSKPVTEITRDPQTGAISFWVDRQPIPDTPAPVPAEPAVEEAGSFTASWAPVNVEGTEVSYTLQVWPATDGLPMPAVWTDFAKALDGWTLEGNTSCSPPRCISARL